MWGKCVYFAKIIPSASSLKEPKLAVIGNKLVNKSQLSYAKFLRVPKTEVYPWPLHMELRGNGKYVRYEIDKAWDAE